MKKAMAWTAVVATWALCAWHLFLVREGVHSPPDGDHLGFVLLYAAAYGIFFLGVGALCLLAVGAMGAILHCVFK